MEGTEVCVCVCVCVCVEEGRVALKDRICLLESSYIVDVLVIILQCGCEEECDVARSSSHSNITAASIETSSVTNRCF